MLTELPSQFDKHFAETLRRIDDVDGSLTPRELRFLALCAACPTARGEILELGAYPGQASIVLARAVHLTGQRRINAVDGLHFEVARKDRLAGLLTPREVYNANLKRAHVFGFVEFHQMESAHLAQIWQRELRLLWIDGTPSYRQTKADLEHFTGFLADGAIVALHDVLSFHDGCLRVFMEDILLGDHFSTAGVCGSIGWAQYHKSPRPGRQARKQKMHLYSRLSRLVPYVALGTEPQGLARARYRLHRWRVPQAEIDPTWLNQVA